MQTIGNQHEFLTPSLPVLPYLCPIIIMITEWNLLKIIQRFQAEIILSDVQNQIQGKASQGSGRKQLSVSHLPLLSGQPVKHMHSDQPQKLLSHLASQGQDKIDKEQKSKDTLETAGRNSDCSRVFSWWIKDHREKSWHLGCNSG